MFSTNTLAMTERIDALLDRLGPALPEGVVLNRDVFRQAEFIERSVHNVTDVLRDATIIVTAVLILFLLNVRTTVITLTVTVWAERPLRRAISAFESAPWRRTSDMTSRSL